MYVRATQQAVRTGRYTERSFVTHDNKRHDTKVEKVVVVVDAFFRSFFVLFFDHIDRGVWSNTYIHGTWYT